MSKSPDNPSLVITKKPIENQLESPNTKKLIISKVAGENFALNSVL